MRGFKTRSRWLGVYFKDSPDPPPPPDYVGAAVAQGSANADAARLTARMNRPDEYTPLGSRTWQDLGGDRMASRINLTPAGQNLYNQNERISTGLGGAAENALGRVQDTFSQPFGASFDRNAYADALMGRAERKFGQDEEAMRSRLMAGGINPGTEAWSREYDQFNQAKNDARMQADIRAGDEMSSELQRQAYQRNIPLSELNALRTGAQPNMPQFQAYGGSGPVQPAPIMQGAQAQYGAGMDAYNAQAAMYGNQMDGLFGLGSAAISAAPFIPGFSDRRLKTDIEALPLTFGGFPLYRFTYVWGEPSVGVMADEVMAVKPEAVQFVNGYAVVNYGAL